MQYRIISPFVCRVTGQRIGPEVKDYVPTPEEAARLIKAQCLVEIPEPVTVEPVKPKKKKG